VWRPRARRKGFHQILFERMNPGPRWDSKEMVQVSIKIETRERRKNNNKGGEKEDICFLGYESLGGFERRELGKYNPEFNSVSGDRRGESDLVRNARHLDQKNA